MKYFKKIGFKFLILLLFILYILYIYFNNLNIEVIDIKKEYLENTIAIKVYIKNTPLSINKRKKQFDKVLNDLNSKYKYNPVYNYEIRFIQNKHKYKNTYDDYLGIFKYNGINRYYGIKNFIGNWKGMKNNKIISKNGVQLIYFYEDLDVSYPFIKVYIDDFSLSINNKKEDIDRIIKILYEDEKCKNSIDLIKNEQKGSIIFIKLKNNFYNSEVTSLNYSNNEFSEISAYYEVGRLYFEDNKKHYTISSILGNNKDLIEYID